MPGKVLDSIALIVYFRDEPDAEASVYRRRAPAVSCRTIAGKSIARDW